MVSIPDNMEDLTAFQSEMQPVWPLITGASKSLGNLTALVVRFCTSIPPSDPRMLLPLGKRALMPLLEASKKTKGRISVLTTGTDSIGFLASLARQTLASEVDVLPASEISPDVLKSIKRKTSRYILIADSSVTLYDSHTLEILRFLVSLPDVASAGCTLTGEATVKNKAMTFKDAGLHAVVPSYEPETLRLARSDMRAALPFATFPTVIPPQKLFMVSCDVWQKLGSGNLEEFALHALKAGYRHLTTDAVRASIAQELVTTNHENISLADEGIQEIIREKTCVFEELSA
jgi:hypothetical protein